MEETNNIYNEFDKHLMEDSKPSLYFNEKINQGDSFNNYPLTLLSALKKTEQSTKYHPEGSVWNHTMFVTDEAATRRKYSKEPRAFMWAALLHDIGKAPTTRIRKGKITSYDHDKVGEELAEKFLMEFTTDEEFINKVSKLVRWHMQPFFVLKNLSFAELDSMLEEVDVDEIGLLAVCDRLGRGEMTKDKIKDEEKGVQMFLQKAKNKLRLK